MSSKLTRWLMLACIVAMAATAQAQLFEPAIDNPSFESPDLGTGGNGNWEDYVEDWAINASGNCYLEDSSWDIVAPNGVNVLKMWSGAAVWQQIGTWTANTDYEIGLWIGRGYDSTAVEVEFWVGGNADEMPVSEYGTIEDTVGATEVTSETLTPTVSEGENEWMTAVLNTGTGFTPGAALWIRIECVTDSGEASWIDDVQVGFVTDPALASNPSPEYEEDDVALDTSLSWTAGQYAVTHDVYFGTDYNDVNDASRDNPLGVLVSEDQSGTSCPPGELALDGVYYWRVDEVNEDPDVIHKGEIWTFNAEPTAFKTVPPVVTASSSRGDDYDPNNTINESGLDELDQHSTGETAMWQSADGEIEGVWIQYEFETEVTLGSIIIWNANPAYETFLGVGMKDVTIETSLDGETWEDLAGALTLNRATGTATYAADNIIPGNNTVAKYVKITCVSSYSSSTKVTRTGLSEVRFMTIPMAARRPDPSSGTTLDALGSLLTWRSGRDAELHSLYLDANETRVAASDSSVLEAELLDTSYDLSASDILYDETYYWMVAETAGEKVTNSETWSFTTPEYLAIDDMESYSSDVNIYDAWVDGWNDNTNGSISGHDDSPYVERDISFDGSGQSLPFYYTNQDKASISTATLDLGGQNWAAGGLKTLVLYLRGDEDNDDATFFVEIDGERVDSDFDVTLPVWQQMVVELNTLNIDLTDVDSFTIGVDDSGAGMIYVDEIRVCQEVALVEEPSDPGDDGLVVYYNMDNNIDNQASSKYDGVEEGALFYSSNTFDDDFGKSLKFDGIDSDVNIPDLGDLIATLSDSSFSAWVSIDDEADGSWMRVFDFGTGTENYLFLCPRTSTAGEVRAAILTQGMTDAGISEIGVTSNSALIEGWHHVACVFEESLLSLYVDGWSAGSVETEGLLLDLGVTTQNWLGKSQWDDDLFMGLMDEFRIYDRALSEGEMRYLAGDR